MNIIPLTSSSSGDGTSWTYSTGSDTIVQQYTFSPTPGVDSYSVSYGSSSNDIFAFYPSVLVLPESDFWDDMRAVFVFVPKTLIRFIDWCIRDIRETERKLVRLWTNW